MASLVNNDKIRIVIHNVNPTTSQRARNTLYYRVSDVVGDITLLEAVTVMSASHATVFKPWQSASTNYDGTSIYRQEPNPTPEVFSASGSGPGTAGGVTIPTQVTGLVSGQEDGYHTGSLTEKHPEGTLQSAEARMFISFPSTTFIATAGTGAMSDAGYNVLNTLVSFLYAPRTLTFTGKSCNLMPVIKNVVVNRLVDPPVSVTSWPNISVFAASRRWATQKSRGDRGQREE